MNNPVHKLISWVYPVQLEKARGELDHELEVNVHNGKITLDSASVNYSFGSLQEVFDRAFEQTGLYDEPFKTALILGFGSGSVAELLLDKSDPEMKITGAEADAEVIRLAKKYFPVATHTNVNIVHSDAAAYNFSSQESYDLIVIDVFLEDRVPASCQSVEFLQQVKARLNKGGRVYFNKMKVQDDAVPIDDLEKNIRAVFGKVKIVRRNISGGSNCVFVAQV